MNIIWMIIIMNTAITSIWSILRIIRKRDVKYAIILFFVPLFGYVLYYLPRWAFMIRKQAGYDRDSLVNRIPVERTVEQTDLEAAFRVAPIQDVLVAGNDMEKRQILLSRLKKNMDESYDSIKVARDDADSESVHYVSSVRMELYKKYYAELEAARTLYIEKKMSEDQETAKESLLRILNEFIRSDLLQKVEMDIFMEEYCERFQDMNRQKYPNAYNNYVYFLCVLYRETEIRLELKEENASLWGYETYNRLLSYFYNENEKETFYWIMKKLRSSRLLLDQKGMELVRFWKEEDTNHVVI